MRTALKTSLLAVATLLAMGAGASAQDSLTPPDDMPLPKRQYVVDLGIGALAQPKYEGADKLMVTPMPIISFARFYFPGFGQVRSTAVSSQVLRDDLRSGLKSIISVHNNQFLIWNIYDPSTSMEARGP